MKTYFRTIVKHFFFWSLALLFWTFMRKVGVSGLHEINLLNYMRFHLVSSFFAGFVFGSVEYALDNFFYKRISFIKIVLLRASMFLFAIVLLVLFALWTFNRIVEVNMSLAGLADSWLFSPQMILLIFYCFLV